MPDFASFDLLDDPRTELGRAEHIAQKHAQHVIFLFGRSGFHVTAKKSKEKTNTSKIQCTVHDYREVYE